MNRLITPFAAMLLVCMLPLPMVRGQTIRGTDGDRPARQSHTPADPATEPSPSSSESPSAEHGPMQIIFAGGITGTLILALLALLSFIAMALGIEHLLAIRRTVLIPPGLADTVRQFLIQGDLRSAQTTCQAQPSTLAAVLEAGFDEAASSWPAIEKAMEQSLASGSARLLRKIDYLSVIGNIAPMLGLLGTVFGMIFAFQEVADTQGAARAAELASGIYQALVTTVGGLMVAIPALAAFAVFRNRVDALIAETAYAAQQATGPLKQALTGRPAAVPVREKPPGGKPATRKPTASQATATADAPACPTTPPTMLPPTLGRKQ